MTMKHRVERVMDSTEPTLTWLVKNMGVVDFSVRPPSCESNALLPKFDFSR